MKAIRREMPALGVRKIQVLLSDSGHAVGRDRLFDILRDSGMLVKHQRHRCVTTNSRHWMRKWPNLIRDVVPSHPNEVWVSDITYVEIVRPCGREFMYLSLVTDAFTHEIVGHALHGSLDTEGPLRALSIALGSFPAGQLKGLIHHSDRGCQYCSTSYVSTLRSHGILISMTENGDPYENAIAERVNGILKTEWLYHMELTSVSHAHKEIERIVHLYNNVRPHESIGNLTPAQARTCGQAPRKLWKNYWRLRQQPAGEESPCGELPAAGRVVADAPAFCAAAVTL